AVPRPPSTGRAPRACRPHVAPLVAVAAGHPTSVVTCVTTTANLWPRWNPVNRQRTDHARWPPPPSGPGGPGATGRHLASCGHEGGVAAADRGAARRGRGARGGLPHAGRRAAGRPG